MASRLSWFVLGIVIACVGLVVGGYLFVRLGGVSMKTSAKPLPLEKTVARMALQASLGSAGAEKNPLSLSETDMLEGAREYKENCAACHGIPGRPRTAFSKGMFPKPPQLFEKKSMVADDPEGITYWKVTNGIRLSGMPAFDGALSDRQRWQVTMLVAHADKLPPSVLAELGRVASEAAQSGR
jgi:thiosulfate dehydrogenase